MAQDIRLLIVDDSKFARATLINTIKRQFPENFDSFNIFEGEDGNEALSVYKESKPDIVFMDITMNGKSGIEALKDIKNYDNNARVVMCSAMGQKAYIDEAIKAGASDFIIKPYNDRQDMIHKVISNVMHD